MGPGEQVLRWSCGWEWGWADQGEEGGEDVAIEFAKLMLSFLCEISFALSSPPVGPQEKV